MSLQAFASVSLTLTNPKLAIASSTIEFKKYFKDHRTQSEHGAITSAASCSSFGCGSLVLCSDHRLGQSHIFIHLIYCSYLYRVLILG